MTEQVQLREAMQDCLKCGWLTKIGAKAKTWKNRYFVMKNNKIYYFKSDKPQTRLSLGSIKVPTWFPEELEVIPSAKSSGTARKTFYHGGPAAARAELECKRSPSFKIMTEDRVYYLFDETNSVGNVQNWIILINTVSEIASQYAVPFEVKYEYVDECSSDSKSRLSADSLEEEIALRLSNTELDNNQNRKSATETQVAVTEATTATKQQQQQQHNNDDNELMRSASHRVPRVTPKEEPARERHNSTNMMFPMSLDQTSNDSEGSRRTATRMRRSIVYEKRNSAGRRMSIAVKQEQLSAEEVERRNRMNRSGRYLALKRLLESKDLSVNLFRLISTLRAIEDELRVKRPGATQKPKPQQQHHTNSPLSLSGGSSTDFSPTSSLSSHHSDVSGSAAARVSTDNKASPFSISLDNNSPSMLMSTSLENEHGEYDDGSADSSTPSSPFTRNSSGDGSAGILQEDALNQKFASLALQQLGLTTGDIDMIDQCLFSDRDVVEDNPESVSWDEVYSFVLETRSEVSTQKLLTHVRNSVAIGLVDFAALQQANEAESSTTQNKGESRPSTRHNLVIQSVIANANTNSDDSTTPTTPSTPTSRRQFTNLNMEALLEQQTLLEQRSGAKSVDDSTEADSTLAVSADDILRRHRRQLSTRLSTNNTRRQAPPPQPQSQQQ